ncbi:hypothetical protein KPATCC21470_7384 [Kitasatospora purpeofusca]
MLVLEPLNRPDSVTSRESDRPLLRPPRPVGGDQLAVPGVRGARGARLRVEVDVDEAEALVVALGPSNRLSL